MENSRFERIANALAKSILANQTKASEEVFVVFDQDGGHEVSEGKFKSIVSSPKSRVAAEMGKDDLNSGPLWTQEDVERDQKFVSYGHKWQIYVSPKVNAESDSQAASGFAGVPQTIKNVVSTMMNQFFHEKKIDKIIFGHGLFAYSIEKARGRFIYDDNATGESKISKEPSYIITIYCDKPRSVAFEIADELRREFKQKEVIVDVGRGGQPVRE